MDSEGGEGRPHLGPSLSVQTDAGKFFAISCKPVGWGRGIISLQDKGDEQSHGTGCAHSAV